MIWKFIDHSGVDNSKFILSESNDVFAAGLGRVFGGEGTVPVVIAGNGIGEGLLCQNVIGG